MVPSRFLKLWNIGIGMFGIEIGSRARCRSNISVSDKAFGIKISCQAYLVYSTGSMSRSQLLRIYTVFFGKHIHKYSDGVLLLFDQIIHFKISNHTNSYARAIIPACMSPHRIVATSPSFVHLSSLSNDILISDIPPTSGNGVVVIYRTHEFRIGKRSYIVFCRVM